LRVKTIILIGFGFLFLSLGAIGLFLPIWPTTPFVLVSAACFSSSPRVKARIMKMTFFREHIENYEKRAGLSRKTVLISLSWLWSMLILSMLLVQLLWLACLLSIIGIAVSLHIIFMAKAKVKKREQEE
jgi:uncharacterized protein